jgi:hypothetical protein
MFDQAILETLYSPCEDTRPETVFSRGIDVIVTVCVTLTVKMRLRNLSHTQRLTDLDSDTTQILAAMTAR